MPKNKKELDMSDIARRAGVCKATVSRTLNNPSRVSAKTRDKVLGVVEQLGYTPNRLAASLRQGRSRNIAIMLPDITNPYFSPIVRKIEVMALKRGYSCILNDTHDDPKLERAFASMVKTRQVDGIITNSQRIPFDIDPNKDVFEQLPPLVNASEFADVDGIPKVGVNNLAIGREAAKHLIDLGHTRIAAIAGPDTIRSSNLREQGYREVLSEHGIEVDERLITRGNYSCESGVEGVRQMMQLRHRPTAIFCFGDSVAIGAFHALRELGYNVPEDVSVIGVDGIAQGEYCAPPLTTIAQPLLEIGEMSCQILLDLIEGKKPEQLSVILPHKLIIRKSTGPAPA